MSVTKLAKRGAHTIRPEDVHIVGCDKGNTAYDRGLAQPERIRMLIPRDLLAEAALAWSDLEAGGPDRAKEMVTDVAVRRGLKLSDVLADVRLVTQLAGGFPVQVPVNVATDGERAVCVDGRRRVWCARAANILRLRRGLRPINVPVMFNRGDRNAISRTALVTNEMVRANTVLQRAEAAAKAWGQSEDMQAIADDIGCSTSSARNLVALGRMLDLLNPYALAAIRSGRVRPSACYAIARNDAMDAEEASAAVLALANAPRVSTPSLKARMAVVVAAVRAGNLAQAQAACAALSGEFKEKPEEE